MKTRIALEEAGEKILNETRTELYLSMHYMGAALDLLSWKMDLSTFTVGTDGAFIRYNPQYLIQTFLNDPKSLPRLYLHMIMHCLLLHPFREDIEAFLKDADCAAVGAIAEAYVSTKQSGTDQENAGVIYAAYVTATLVNNSIKKSAGTPEDPIMEEIEFFSLMPSDVYVIGNILKKLFGEEKKKADSRKHFAKQQLGK